MGDGAAQKPVKLLSGGNPQIAKGDGDGPVQAYIAAMPGWKSAAGARIDRLAAEAVPGLRKAVRWNSAFYGAPDGGWFLAFHCFTNYVKLTFFDGTSLVPPPPGPSKTPGTRYYDLYESDAVTDDQLKDWFRQAAALPGWTP